MPDPLPNTRAAISFLEQWSSHGPWILIAIDPDGKGIETATFTAQSNGHLYTWIEKYNNVRNIYFEVNPCLREINNHEHPKIGDISVLAWLHVDLDPRAGEDIEAERKRILKTLQKPPNDLPIPNCITFSGGGYQAFWRLKEAVPVNGDTTIAEDVKRYNLQLETLFAADSCHNINRIMRLPGTINVPNAKKLAKGRVRELAEVISFDTGSYDITQFTKAPLIEIKDSTTFVKPVEISGNLQRIDPDEFDKLKVPLRYKAIALHGHNKLAEGNKAGDDSRSAWLFDFLCGMCRAHVSDDNIYSVITDPTYKISDSILDKGSSADKYARRQIARAREISIDPKLCEMNEKHAVIRNIGGKCLVAEETTDILGTVMTYQTFADLNNRYANQFVDITNGKGKITQTTLGKWWTTHPHRREYQSVVFSPGQETGESYNLWRGFSCQPRKGDCKLYLKHIEDNVCGGNVECYRYLIQWMATLVQNPGSQGHVAIVLRGKRGTGKSFFADEFGSLLGRHYMAVSNSQHMVGNFNSHLQSTILLFADEAFFAGDKKHESVLKTLITQPTIIVEPKYMNAYSSPNYVHLILASNDNWVVPAGPDERRYFVLDVCDTVMQNHDYFAAIAEQMENGGRAALLDYLLNVDLTDFDVRQAPKTAALLEQQRISMSPLEEWWFAKLEVGLIEKDSDRWPKTVCAEELYADYIDHCSSYRNRVDNRTPWYQKFCALIPGKLEKRQAIWSLPLSSKLTSTARIVYEDRRTVVYDLPTLAACRKQWCKRFGHVEWVEIEVAIERENLF